MVKGRPCSAEESRKTPPPAQLAVLVLMLPRVWLTIILPGTKVRLSVLKILLSFLPFLKTVTTFASYQPKQILTSAAALFVPEGFTTVFYFYIQLCNKEFFQLIGVVTSTS